MQEMSAFVLLCIAKNTSVFFYKHFIQKRITNLLNYVRLFLNALLLNAGCPKNSCAEIKLFGQPVKYVLNEISYVCFLSALKNKTILFFLILLSKIKHKTTCQVDCHVLKEFMKI